MFRHFLMAMREGGTGPTAAPAYGYRIRDELSRDSLSNAPPADQRLVESPERRSYSDLLRTRITAERDRAVEHGWQMMTQKQFIRAITRFEAAEAADRTCSAARVGIFFAALLDESVARADAALGRIIDSDPEVFKLDIDIRVKCPFPELLAQTTSSLGRAARQNPDKPGALAVNAFYLWFSGEREEALRMADEIHRNHRTSPLAVIAARMRGETDTSNSGLSG
jgi:hypothetical protein